MRENRRSDKEECGATNETRHGYDPPHTLLASNVAGAVTTAIMNETALQADRSIQELVMQIFPKMIKEDEKKVRSKSTRGSDKILLVDCNDETSRARLVSLT